MNKHDANIKKGRLINFQIGIIAIISFCYVIHEVKHYTPKKAKTIALIDLDTYTTMGPVEAYIEKPIIVEISKPKPIEKPKPAITIDKVEPQIIDNDTKTIKFNDQKTITKPVGLKKSTTATKPVSKPIKIITPTTYTSMSVDVLPVFPGCDKYTTNDERASCFQEKVQRMIIRKFDRNLGNKLGLTGTQRINLYFEIDNKGSVTNIKARSNYPEFITEAKRIAGTLPKMQPAKRGNTSVKMAYNVPIIFNINN